MELFHQPNILKNKGFLVLSDQFSTRTTTYWDGYFYLIVRAQCPMSDCIILTEGTSIGHVEV